MVKSANEIWADFNTEGVPGSGDKEPNKVEIRAWGSMLEAGMLGSSAGSAVFGMRATMDANLSYPANTMAWVVADPIPANNGIYRKDMGLGLGGWTRLADLPYEFIKATNSGAGTANAIIASTSLPIPENDAEALIALPIFVTNTASPVTVSINGATPLTIKTNSGSDVSVGGLTAGTIVSGYKSGSTFRMLSDQSSIAIQAAAEGAAELAEAWAQGTEPGGPGTKSAKEWAEDVGGIALGIASFSFAGDGVETDFTLPVAPGIAGNVRVAIDGVSQRPTAAYTVSGTTLQFTAQPPDGSEIFGFIITATEIEIGVPDAGSVGAAQIDQNDAPAIMDAIDGQALYAACQGRLTLTTGVPVTTADVSGAGTVYWSPYMGNRVWLYSGTIWTSFAPGELSIALSGGTASRPHDVFMDYNGGTPQMVLTAWTNDTTRATALAQQNGILVKSGATGQRYLGTIYLDASKQCADSMAKRHVWNMYNRKPRPMRVLEGTDTWNYTTATTRQANGSAGNQLDFVRGLDEDIAEAFVQVCASNGTVPCAVQAYIGLDSTTAAAAGSTFAFTELQNANRLMSAFAKYSGLPGLGRHILTWLERSQATGTTTWYGDNGGTTSVQSGMSGQVYA